MREPLAHVFSQGRALHATCCAFTLSSGVAQPSLLARCQAGEGHALEGVISSAHQVLEDVC